MLGSFQKSRETVQALEQIKRWTRTRFSLTEASTVFASEVACSLPGCPPIETIVGFWTEDGTRHHFKVFKPAESVTEEDIPFAWLREALVVSDNAGCDC